MEKIYIIKYRMAEKLDPLLYNGSTSNYQLLKKLRKLKIAIKKVCMKNQLPQFDTVPGFYLINLADFHVHSPTVGTHWTALYLTHEEGRKRVMYFDSAGAPPPQSVLEFGSRWENQHSLPPSQIPQQVPKTAALLQVTSHGPLTTRRCSIHPYNTA